MHQMNPRKRYAEGVLPPQQHAVLTFVSTHIRQHGYPPTVAQIMEHLEVSSTFGVRKHLDALEKKGYISREMGLSRAMRVLKLPNAGRTPIHRVELFDATGRNCGYVESDNCDALQSVGKHWQNVNGLYTFKLVTLA